MLSLWMLDDARTLDAQTAPHGSSDPSSTDAFRREKSCRDVFVNAQDPRSVNPTSRRSVGSSRLSRKSRKCERSRPWILDLGPWNGHDLPKMVCRAHVCAVTSLSSPESFVRSSSSREIPVTTPRGLSHPGSVSWNYPCALRPAPWPLALAH